MFTDAKYLTCLPEVKVTAFAIFLPADAEKEHAAIFCFLPDTVLFGMRKQKHSLRTTYNYTRATAVIFLLFIIDRRLIIKKSSYIQREKSFSNERWTSTNM